MRKLKWMKRVFVAVGILSFLYMLGIGGNCDVEAELGYALYPRSWYQIRFSIGTIVLSLSFIGVRFTEWLKYLSYNKLDRLEREYGRNDRMVSLYRKLLHFFKG